jgi:xanthine dehydrogenase accessory factor
MDVHVDPLSPSPRLYVVGAGHVGLHLARSAFDAGFRVHVVDDREKFANRDRFPDAQEVVTAPIPEWLETADIPPGAYAVIVTRGHTHDLEALRSLVGRDLKYLGLIGSRAKVVRIFEALAADGTPPDRLARVYAPIGLDIGAVTPAEIAVSILAQLIAVRRGVDISHLSMRRAPVPSVESRR